MKQRGRFYHGKKAGFLWGTLNRVIVFLAAAFLFCGGMNALSSKAGQEKKKSIEEAVWRGITQCYAMEGRYPKSLEYLKKEYGITYDTSEFFVDYQALGGNIMPDVTIIEK